MRRRILRILLQRGERGRLEKEQEQGRRRLDLHKVGWFGVNSLNVILLRATVRRKVGEAKGGAIRARGRIREGRGGNAASVSPFPFSTPAPALAFSSLFPMTESVALAMSSCSCEGSFPQCMGNARALRLEWVVGSGSILIEAGGVGGGIREKRKGITFEM